MSIQRGPVEGGDLAATKIIQSCWFQFYTNYLLLLLSCADAGSARTWSCTSPKSPWRAAVRMSSCLIRRAYNKKRGHTTATAAKIQALRKAFKTTDVMTSSCKLKHRTTCLQGLSQYFENRSTQAAECSCTWQISNIKIKRYN